LIGKFRKFLKRNFWKIQNLKFTTKKRRFLFLKLFSFSKKKDFTDVDIEQKVKKIDEKKIDEKQSLIPAFVDTAGGVDPL